MTDATESIFCVAVTMVFVTEKIFATLDKMFCEAENMTNRKNELHFDW
jgi:hypothetical protein